VAADNILERDRTANYDAVPRVVFTDPVAATGYGGGHIERPRSPDREAAGVDPANTYLGGTDPWR
jgi:hypothetical protein